MTQKEMIVLLKKTQTDLNRLTQEIENLDMTNPYDRSKLLVLPNLIRNTRTEVERINYYLNNPDKIYTPFPSKADDYFANRIQ